MPVMFPAQLFTWVWFTPFKPTNNPSTKIICLLGTPRISTGSNNQTKFWQFSGTEDKFMLHDLLVHFPTIS